MNREEAIIFRKKIEQASAWTNDADAVEMIELFPHWEKRIGTDVIIGERLQDEGILYKVIQAHTIQSDWKPKDTPSLFRAVSVEEYPQWVQPTGVADAYMQGDKVTDESIRWISNIDNNVWKPGVFGWSEAN